MSEIESKETNEIEDQSNKLLLSNKEYMQSLVLNAGYKSG
jgi:hypothetical protein